MPDQGRRAGTYELFMTFLSPSNSTWLRAREPQAERWIQASRKNKTCSAQIVQPASAHGQWGALIWGLSTSYEGRSEDIALTICGDGVRKP